MLISLSIHLILLAILSLSRAQQVVVTTDANGDPLTTTLA